MASFFCWYLTLLLIGALYLPLSAMLFRDWNDRGWIFSKSLGILCGGYLMWVLNTAHVLKFTTGACVASLVVPTGIVAVAGGFLTWKREGGAKFGALLIVPIMI